MEQVVAASGAPRLFYLPLRRRLPPPPPARPSPVLTHPLLLQVLFVQKELDVFRIPPRTGAGEQGCGLARAARCCSSLRSRVPPRFHPTVLNVCACRNGLL